MQSITYNPVGIIHSPFREPAGTPIQPRASEGTEGSVEIYEEYREGLKDIDGFSHLTLVYHFHLSKEPVLTVTPFMDDRQHGVFATRAPNRPNSIGISVVRLVRSDHGILHVIDLDVLDGTPLLDLKPFVPEFHNTEVTKRGWLEKNLDRLRSSMDDGRFAG